LSMISLQSRFCLFIVGVFYVLSGMLSPVFLKTI
jgi:hypothetical protein